jgi:protein O-GlcNAc transferase
MRSSLASTLLEMGRAEESLTALDEGGESSASDPVLARVRATVLNYLDGATREQSLLAHQAFGTVLAQSQGLPAASDRGPAWRQRDPERPLRVGVLSAELRRHSVASFLEAWLRSARGSAITIICYQSNRAEDEVTKRLEGVASDWRRVAHRSGAELAELIRADGIDVLVETSGLTEGNRLDVLVRRAAPAQVSFLGYPNTTGVPGVDWRIVDSSSDPPDEERWHSERLMRMAGCFLCWTPPEDGPGPERDGEPGAPLVLGSFNSAEKITPGVVRRWGAVMRRAPGARLVLKAHAFKDAAVRGDLARRFSEVGVTGGRLELLGPLANPAEHLRAYQRIDLSLDTFPYHGTTTTLESLWMGVPVVTLAGDRHASRVGVTILGGVGLKGWIAATEEEYVEKVAAIAADGERVNSLRRGRSALRTRLEASSLCDGAGYARRMEDAIRQMWRLWCTRSP